METSESITIGTLNLLEAVRFLDRPIKFYNAGSSESFGDTQGLAADENTPFRPRSPYGVAKAAAAYNLFACSGILFNHESPLRPERFVTQKIISTACRIAVGSQEKLFLGNIDIERDWGWAPDYVEAMYLILQYETPDDYVIATGKSCKLQDFVAATFAELGLDWKEHVMVDTSLYRPTDIALSRGNPTKAKEQLGWQAKYFIKDIVRMMIQAK
jgi:GDPmannose 4,6-dehydratase